MVHNGTTQHLDGFKCPTEYDSTRLKGWVKVKVKVGVGESGKGNGKVKGGHNVLPVNLLPYLAEA